MAEEKAVLMYKGHPLMRKDNLIYYGSMADTPILLCSRSWRARSKATPT